MLDVDDCVIDGDAIIMVFGIEIDEKRCFITDCDRLGDEDVMD